MLDYISNMKKKWLSNVEKKWKKKGRDPGNV
jgi:hypothetical protein